MAIAALVVWAFTAAAGAYLLMNVIAAKRAEGDRPVAAPAAPGAGGTAAPAQAPPTGGSVTESVPPGPSAAPASAGTAAVDSLAMPTPIPRTKVTVGPDDHPVREFSHPALGVSGVAFWLAFVATHGLAFAWLACGVLAATAGIGVSWLVSNARSAGRRGTKGPPVPAHLITIHGVAAATTAGLVIVTLLTTAHA